jgi:hypothetical protein
VTEPSSRAPAEVEEEIFQKARAKLLEKTEEVPAPSGAETPPGPAPAATGRGAEIVATVLGVAAVVLSLLGRLDPENLSGCKDFGSLLLLIVGVIWFGIWGQRQKALKANPPTPAAPPRSGWRRLGKSLFWFLVVELVVLPPIDAFWIVAVLLLHETGHFLGMRAVGYLDLKMFFVPGLGAAVSGNKQGIAAWKEAIALLLGPVPGLLLGCVLYFLDQSEPMPGLRRGAAWLVTINFLNLLPFEPLDGGKLFHRFLFSRFRLLESAAMVMAAVGLVMVCWGPAWILIVLAGSFALFVLAPARYRLATAALAVQERWPALPDSLANLTEEQWRDLFERTKQQFQIRKSITAITESQITTVVSTYSNIMKQIHARAVLPPASGPATAAVAAVYFAVVALVVATASLTGLGADAGNLPLLLRGQTPSHGAAEG